MLGRRILFIALVPYVIWLVFCYRYHLIDGVNLAVHEVGHIVFTPFGQTMHMLGGSIGQMVFPIALIIYFLRRAERFEAAVCTVWAAESLMYMAVYLGDAKAQALPLVGGHIHDWNWLLGRIGMVDQCELIASLMHGFASLVAIGAMVAAGYTIRPGARQAGDPEGAIDPYGDVDLSDDWRKDAA